MQGQHFVKNELRKKPEDRQGSLNKKTSDIFAGVENRSKNLASLLKPGPNPLTRSFGANPFFRSVDTALQTAQELVSPFGLIDTILQNFDKSISHFVALTENMESVDCYKRTRNKVLGEDTRTIGDDQDVKESLPIINPVVDGRLKDVAGAAV